MLTLPARAEDEDETDEDGARNGIEDETARQMAAAGALIHAAAIHATVRGEVRHMT